MKKIHAPIPLPFLKIFVLGVICFLISACTVDGAEVAGEGSNMDANQARDMNDGVDDSSRLSLQGFAFLKELVASDESWAEGGRLHVTVPVIWVFSPQGQLTRMFGSDALDEFLTEFSTVDPDARNVTCEQIETVVAGASGEEWSMGCTADKWTVLLLLSNHAKCPESCPRYENVVAQAQKDNPNALQVRTLVLNFE